MGSRELEPALRRLGIDAQIVEAPGLGSADFAFEGNGPTGTIQVGIERKTLPDLVDSLRTGRLQGADRRTQLSRLRQDYDVAWLLVEGELTSNRMGRMFGRQGSKRRPLPGTMTEDALTKTLLSLELQGGLRVARTGSLKQSAQWIASCARWWTDKTWDEHTTLTTPYERNVLPVSLFRERAMKLPGVGLAVSKSLEAACGGDEMLLHHLSLTALAEMPVSLPNGTRKLGLQKAEPIVQALRKLRGN